MIRLRYLCVSALLCTTLASLSNAATTTVSFNLHDANKPPPVITNNASLEDDPISDGVKYWIPQSAGKAGTIVYRIDLPYAPKHCLLWCQVNSYQSLDPGSFASLEVSADGENYTGVHAPTSTRNIDISPLLAEGGTTLFVRAKILSSLRHQSGQCFYSQFLRSQKPSTAEGGKPSFQLTLSDAYHPGDFHSWAKEAAQWIIQVHASRRSVPEGFEVDPGLLRSAERASKHAEKYLSMRKPRRWTAAFSDHSTEAMFIGHDPGAVWLSADNKERRRVELTAISEECLSDIETLHAQGLRVRESVDALRAFLIGTDTPHPPPTSLCPKLSVPAIYIPARDEQGKVRGRHLVVRVTGIGEDRAIIYKGKSGEQTVAVRDMHQPDKNYVDHMLKVLSMQSRCDFKSNRHLRDQQKRQENWLALVAEYDWLDGPERAADLALWKTAMDNLKKIEHGETKRDALRALISIQRLEAGVVESIVVDSWVRRYTLDSFLGDGWVKNGGGLGSHMRRRDWWAKRIR